MKKGYFILLLITLFIIKVNALSLDLEKPFIYFPKEGDYVLQGFTSVEDKLFTVFINSEEDKPLIKIFDIETGDLIKQFISQPVGHANDVTYNNKEKKIYVVHGNGQKIVHIFDGTNFEYLDTKNIGLPIRSMTYISDKDMYAVRTVSVGYYLKGDLSINSRIPFIVGMNFRTDVAKQGWAYNEGKLFYSTWSWIRLGGNGSNTIYVYNLEGDSINTLTTDGGIGELENVAFYEDKMILGINTYDDYISFYKTNKPDIKMEMIETVEDEIKEEKESFSYAPIIIVIIVVLIDIVLFVIYKKRCK